MPYGKDTSEEPGRRGQAQRHDALVWRGETRRSASVYAPDARLLPPILDVQTGEDIQRYWQGAVDAGLRYGHIDTINYEEHGDVAIEEGRWELRADADSPVVDAGKFLIVHRRQPDGTWKYALDMFNSSLAPASA